MVCFNVTGAARKKLVKKLESLTGARPVYQGMPSMAFVVGDYTVTKDGAVEGGLPQEYIEALKRAGFTPQVAEDDGPAAPGRAAITIPAESYSDRAVDNFTNMIESKGALIKQAFEITDLGFDREEEGLKIHWFDGREISDETKDIAVTFIKAMLVKSGQQKYVSAKPVETDNPKYNFRVFLNALGFIGSEYKGFRKEMMKNLKGSAAFRHPMAAKEAGA